MTRWSLSKYLFSRLCNFLEAEIWQSCGPKGLKSSGGLIHPAGITYEYVCIGANKGYFETIQVDGYIVNPAIVSVALSEYLYVVARGKGLLVESTLLIDNRNAIEIHDTIREQLKTRLHGKIIPHERKRFCLRYEPYHRIVQYWISLLHCIHK